MSPTKTPIASIHKYIEHICKIVSICDQLVSWMCLCATNCSCFTRPDIRDKRCLSWWAGVGWGGVKFKHIVLLLRNYRSCKLIFVKQNNSGRQGLIYGDTAFHSPNSTTKVPSNFLYKLHLNWQYNCLSLRCSWSIACRRCSNYIFILGLTTGINMLHKGNCKTRRDAFKS